MRRVPARKEFARLRRTVWAYYRAHGRHDLPWRKTRDPYRILVSEVMLQQTQVARVVPKYRAFIARFPTVGSLAGAPRADVLVAWQGLGYNRRARMLHEAAQVVAETYGGRMPRTGEGLRALPGVGPYTAAAVCTFAYDRPAGMVETNIRTVLFHHLLGARTGVPDSELTELAEVLCDRTRPREWYWAMMDYGAHLKERGVRLNDRSKHYARQSAFAGSDRQIRGTIVRALADRGGTRSAALVRAVQAAHAHTSAVRIRTQLERLAAEGLVRCVAGSWSL